MINTNIQEVLLRNRKNLLVMFIIKNSEGKILVTSNPYLNYYSLPVKHIKLTEIEENAKSIEAISILSEFLKKEFDFAGTLVKYIEGLRIVANIEGEMKLCNLICFEIESDEDLKEALDKSIPFVSSEDYHDKQFYTLEEIKTYSWNKNIDNASAYFAMRASEAKETTGITVETNIDLNIN